MPINRLRNGEVSLFNIDEQEFVLWDALIEILVENEGLYVWWNTVVEGYEYGE